MSDVRRNETHFAGTSSAQNSQFACYGISANGSLLVAFS